MSCARETYRIDHSVSHSRPQRSGSGNSVRNLGASDWASLAPLPFGAAWLALRLPAVGLEDRGDEAREALLDLAAAGRVEHLDAAAFAADQAGVAEGLEVLGEGGLGDRLL